MPVNPAECSVRYLLRRAAALRDLITAKERELASVRQELDRRATLGAVKSMPLVSDRDREIYAAIQGGESMQSVGQRLGLSRERIRQIRQRTMRMLTAQAARQAEAADNDPARCVWVNPDHG